MNLAPTPVVPSAVLVAVIAHKRAWDAACGALRVHATWARHGARPERIAAAETARAVAAFDLDLATRALADAMQKWELP